MSPKKSTRTTPVSRTSQDPQPETAPVAKPRAGSRAVKAKAAPAPVTPAIPESGSTVKPAARPSAKARTKTTPAGAAKPKAAEAPPVATRAESQPSQGDVPPAPAQATAPEPAAAAAIVESPAAEVVRVVTDEDIRIRAYFLSIEHRAKGGSDVDFWLIAERELRHGIKARD